METCTAASDRGRGPPRKKKLQASWTQYPVKKTRSVGGLSDYDQSINILFFAILFGAI